MRYPPHLQQILGVLYLLLGACDGDDAIIGTREGLVNCDAGTGFLPDLSNPRSTFAYDSAGQLQQNQGSSYILIYFIFNFSSTILVQTIFFLLPYSTHAFLTLTNVMETSSIS